VVTISKSPSNTASYSRRLELRHIFSFCDLGKMDKTGDITSLNVFIKGEIQAKD